MSLRCLPVEIVSAGMQNAGPRLGEFRFVREIKDCCYPEIGLGFKADFFVFLPISFNRSCYNRIERIAFRERADLL